jgi:hypothetical protein
LEDQIKNLVANNEKNLRAHKDSHTSELKELDKLRAKTEKDYMGSGKKAQEAFDL